MVKYDVVIVGAGPAGLMAARTAAEAGLKAALLERKRDVCKIHRSCGGVINVNEPTFGEVVCFDEDRQRIDFTKLGFSIPYSGPHQNVYGFHLYSPAGVRIEFGNFALLRQAPRDNRLGVAISKELLLQTLLDQAQAAGAELFPNTNITSVRQRGAGALVECDDGRQYEGAFVFAADGINSRIARGLKLNRDRHFFGTSRDTSLAVRGTACPDPEGFLFMITPRGIFSMIPVAEKDCYHIYASTYQRGVNPSDLLSYFVHEDPTFSAWYADSEILEERTSCVVNLMSPLEVPYRDGVLFIGDACWRREMSNVGALCTGWKAAETIAAAMRAGTTGGEAVRPYIDWYRRHYYGPFGDRKQAGRDFTKYLDPEDIDYLMGLPDAVFPQTMDIFKVVKSIGKTYGDLLAGVYDERPAVMRKLMKIRENMDEDMQERISWGFKNV